MNSLNIFALSGFLNFIVSIVLGILIFVKNPKGAVHKSYLFYSLSIAFWSLGYWQWFVADGKAEALFWTRFLTAGSILIPVSYYRFILAFLFLQSDKKKQKILYFGYIISFVFLILNFTPLLVKNVAPKLSFDFWPEPGLCYPLFMATFFIFVIYSIALLFASLKKSTGNRHNQILYIFIGSIMGFGGGSTNFPLWYDIPVYPYGNFAVLIFFLTFSYAIVRYHIMDISVVFKRTAVYSLSAGLLTGLFVVFVLAITHLFSSYVAVDSFNVSIFAAVLIALLFNPLRNKVQAIIDKVFYKKTYNYYLTVQQVSSSLASTFDLQGIYKFIGNIIYEVLGLQSVYLLAPFPGVGYKVVYHESKQSNRKGQQTQLSGTESGLKIGARSDVVSFCKKSGDVIIKDALPALEVSLGMEAIEQIINDLEPFLGEALVPVFVNDKLTLLMILGEKLSGDMFTSEDIHLLNTIADQTAIAIKNAGLYRDKVKSERLASIGMMSATFAHEIRNPLTSLKTFAQLIPEKYNDPEFRDKFSKIVLGEIERVNRLIEDLLDFSNDKKTPGVNIFDIKVLLDELVDYVKDRLEIEKRNIMVEKEYEENVVQLSGNQGRLKHAFINIMNNGCQAMNGDGVLKIRISMTERYVDVAMTDTGEGIPAEDIERIFDPFVTTKEMGIGLGLAISKKIVEDHGGRIKVRSKLRKGTTFTVSLPVDRNSNGEMNDIKQRVNMEIA